MRVVLDPALTALAYRCFPDGCPRGRTCCVGLVVEVSRREVRAIDSLMDELARLRPKLRRRATYANVFLEEPPGYVIESGDDGACPFLFRTGTHALCAIHRVALDTGRPVGRFKPAACRHWPITLDVGPDGVVRVGVQPAARQIGCVAPRHELPGKPSVLEAFRDELVELTTG